MQNLDVFDYKSISLFMYFFSKHTFLFVHNFFCQNAHSALRGLTQWNFPKVLQESKIFPKFGVRLGAEQIFSGIISFALQISKQRNSGTIGKIQQIKLLFSFKIFYVLNDWYLTTQYSYDGWGEGIEVILPPMQTYQKSIFYFNDLSWTNRRSIWGFTQKLVYNLCYRRGGTGSAGGL